MQAEPEKTDETKVDWSKRSVDPMVRMRWNASIKVNPANAADGHHYGTRFYPDGQTEDFYVE